MKSLFLDDNYDLIPYQTLCKGEIKERSPITRVDTWNIWSFTQLSNDSAFEPFQAGFSPYPTGVVCIKDARISRFKQSLNYVQNKTMMFLKLMVFNPAPAVASIMECASTLSFYFIWIWKICTNSMETRIKLEQFLIKQLLFEKKVSTIIFVFYLHLTLIN